MCDVDTSLQRLVIRQLVFLLNDWDDYQYFIRMIAKI